MTTRHEGQLAWMAVAGVFAILSTLLVSGAGAQARQFKVGDRVEIDTFLRGDYPGADKLAKWSAGTVVRLDNPEDRFGAYIVKVDRDGIEMRIRFVDTRWIRTPQAKPADENKSGGATRPNQSPAAGAYKPGANPAKEFNVGDRVEVDVLMISTTSPAEMQKWKAGTVRAIDRRPGYRPAYVVRIDPLPGQLPDDYNIPITPNAVERNWIRPGRGTVPKIVYDKLRVDAHDTVLADRAVIDGEHMDQPPAHNGSPPPTELIKKLIRAAMGEHPSPVGGQGATRVDILQFAVGPPHRWNLRVDTGFGGTPDTLVYPVRVKFTKKSFYREQNIEIADRQQLFMCHVDIGVWVAGPGQVLNEGKKSQIPVTK